MGAVEALSISVGILLFFFKRKFLKKEQNAKEKIQKR